MKRKPQPKPDRNGVLIGELMILAYSVGERIREFEELCRKFQHIQFTLEKLRRDYDKEA